MALDLNPNIGWKLYNQIGVEGKKGFHLLIHSQKPGKFGQDICKSDF